MGRRTRRASGSSDLTRTPVPTLPTAESGDFFLEYDATMDAPHQAGAAGHDAEAPRVPASDRLQLEIALLAAESSPMADDTERAGDGGSAILLAVSDPDIRDYIRQCLR